MGNSIDLGDRAPYALFARVADRLTKKGRPMTKQAARQQFLKGDAEVVEMVAAELERMDTLKRRAMRRLVNAVSA